MTHALWCFMCTSTCVAIVGLTAAAGFALMRLLDEFAPDVLDWLGFYDEPEYLKEGRNGFENRL